MTTITIDKAVPMPSHGGQKYPFPDMGVGDSFHAKGKTTTQLHAAAVSWAKSRAVEYKWVARTEGKGARIWRRA